MKFLISTTEVHRVDTENEAVMLIEDAKKDGNFILTKYSTEHKEKKAKGEIVEEYQLVKAKLEFNAEKDPEQHILVSYEMEF